MFYPYDNYDGTYNEWDEEDDKAFIHAAHSISYLERVELQGFRTGYISAMRYMKNRIGSKFQFPESGRFWDHVDKLKKGE